MQVGSGNFLDPRQRLQFHRTELREIYLGPWQKVEFGARAAWPRQLRLYKGLNVFLEYAVFRSTALHQIDIHSQFARKLPDGRAGMGGREGALILRRRGNRWFALG